MESLDEGLSTRFTPSEVAARDVALYLGRISGIDTTGIVPSRRINNKSMARSIKPWKETASLNSEIPQAVLAKKMRLDNEGNNAFNR